MDNKFRGTHDLEVIIEAQQNNIVILEKIIQQYKDEIGMVKKQIALLQDSIRRYEWKKK